MKIQVKNCSECSFNNSLKDYEYYNLDMKIESNDYESLPKDKVHEDCLLLKEEEIIVYVKK